MLAGFGVDRELLLRCRRTGAPTAGSAGRWPTWSRTPATVYRRAEPGLRAAGAGRAALRALRVRRSTGTSSTEIEAADYDVLHRRVAVPIRRRLAVAGPALLRVPG